MPWTKIANLQGPQGAVGPIGLPGVNAAPADSAVAGYVAGPSSTATAIATNFGNHVMVVGAGIDRTGATDSTSAIQAFINAYPGRRLLLPAGVYQFTQLTLSKGQHLAGVGQQDWRDRTTSFGTPGFLVNANYSGTVLRSTLTTTAAAITIVDGEPDSGGVSDLTLIGPGTGTSIGILWGNISNAVVNALCRSVKVANFFVGVRVTSVFEGSFYDLMIRGCPLGIDLTTAANNNAFYMLDTQFCGDGVRIGSASTANAFYSYIAQSNSGIGVTIGGLKNAWYNPYFEVNSGGSVVFTSTAIGNVIHEPFVDPPGSITIQSGALYTSITGYGGYGATPAVTNAGTGTYLQGRFNNLTDTGTNTVVVDVGLNGTTFAARLAYTPTMSGFTPGNGTVVGRYSKQGKTLSGTVIFTLGSTTVIAGTPTFTLPLPPFSAPGGLPTQALIFHAGWYQGMAIVAAAGNVTVGYSNFTTGQFSAFTSTVPFTWVAGDVITIAFSYEIA